MLHISISETRQKNQTKFDEYSLSLPVGQGVLLQGNTKIITEVFNRILYQKHCVFSLDNEHLEDNQLQHNITLFSISRSRC